MFTLNHPKLANARFHVDSNSKIPYLVFDDAFNGSVKILKINREKKKNAFDDWLYLALTDALNTYAQDEKILAVILTGTGDVSLILCPLFFYVD